jgi:peptide/nickel transport system substrate-binding protein
MNRWQKLASAAILAWEMAVGAPGSAAAQTKPEGEMRFALYVTLAPAWLDPGEAVPDNLTPFWMMYALHDALVKPMPGNLMANSLAESWSKSEDRLVYEFTLRKGLKFHNGDPFTAEDVVFSFKRAKRAQLHEKVKEVVIVDPLYFWPSGLGPRVEEASLMKIDPFPWSAPLEDVRLKRP